MGQVRGLKHQIAGTVGRECDGEGLHRAIVRLSGRIDMPLKQHLRLTFHGTVFDLEKYAVGCPGLESRRHDAEPAAHLAYMGRNVEFDLTLRMNEEHGNFTDGGPLYTR